MTSFMICAHENRKSPATWTADASCPFCRIVNGELNAHKVFENELVVAFLDILPLRPGHTLVCPKAHVPHLSDLPAELAGALGTAVSHVADALTKAMDNRALNVVCNQVYAQAVPHVHYHIVPAPNFDNSSVAPILAPVTAADPPTQKEMHRLEFEAREELDDEDAVRLVQLIRSKL